MIDSNYRWQLWLHVIMDYNPRPFCKEAQ